jgi:outer membrane lipoprotein-sorting protein
MKTAVVRPPVSICVLALSVLMLATNACQRAPETNANLNVNSVSNANVVSNTNVSTEPISVIAAREPDKYRATLVFTAQTQGGEKTIGIPTLSAEVARSGADRRVSFKLPDGSDLIYLDHAGTQYAIAPGRKQYAELTPEATGFQLHKLMTPGQLVAYLEKLKGIEAVGEESVNGRTALKYRYKLNAKTGTSAGDVSTESFVYVDKETGLPLRTELFTEASGNVQGVKGAKIVAELLDISTDVSPTLFEVPAGLNKVPAEQVKAQIDAVTGTVAAVLRTLLSNMNSGSTAAPPASPAAAASPSASPRPTN